MAANSPSPHSSPSTPSPVSTPAGSPPPPPLPPSSSSAPASSQPTADPPPPQSPSSPSNGTSSPPVSPPPEPVTSPSARSLSPSPPPPANVPSPSTSPPPMNPRPTKSPPPSSPPLPPADPPTVSPSPPVANPPMSSPPPPVTNPPVSSAPPPSAETPKNLPPRTPTKTPVTPPPSPPTQPSKSASPPAPSGPPKPPTPAAKPPQNSPPPPPPPSKSPQNSPPPTPASKPPQNSPPTPSSKSPQNSPPPHTSNPPESSPPPPLTPPDLSPPPSRLTPLPSVSPPTSPPSSNYTPKSSPPPPPVIHLSPPPSSHLTPPSSSPPSQVPISPSSSPNTSNSNSSAPEKSNSTSNGGLGTGGAVAIGLVLGFILLSVIGIAAWFMRKRKKKASGFSGGYIMPTSMGSSPKSDSALLKVQTVGNHPGSGSGPSGRDFVHSPSEPGGLGNSRSWFTYEELAEATNGFSAQNLLGEGGFGSVYRGYLADGREVAVKQLKIGGGQGEREFKAEVEIISRIHHRHLVSLVGYCISENRRLLVYDYVPNNTLHFHLHGEGRPVMDWATRVKIAAGAARGIAYLHEDCHPRIIHRDIKSANILLDNNFDARVSDFGLAKLALDANTHVTTRVMGTFGYMAPEYASSGKLTEKSDVFSFGVVLLELITGRKPVDISQPLGEESLVEWARPLLSHALDSEEFEGLADQRLERNYVDSEMFRMIEAAAACVRHSAAKRPRMGQVVRAFDSMAASDLTNGMRVGESEIFNSAQQSAEIRLFRRMAFGSQEYSTDFFSQSSFE